MAITYYKSFFNTNSITNYHVSECGCNVDGSIDNLCDKYTGQCSCHDNVIGVKCSECEPGYYGFSNCRGI